MRQNFSKLTIVFAVSSLLALTGCSGGSAGPDGNDAGTGGIGGSAMCETDATSTYDAIQEVIFEGRGCTASACHGDATQAGLDLRAGASHASLIGVPSTRSDNDRVFPGEQAFSFLFEKVAAATNGETLPTEAGGVMPAGGGTPLSADELESLRLWIRGGAPEEGIVAGTSDLLACGLSNDADPNKIPPPDAPDPEAGVQFYAGGWDVPSGKEGEVCYATYYDFTGKIPEMAKTRCSPNGTEERDCFAYRTDTLHQDPQSHHSIVDIYVGDADHTDSGWGDWSCLGGANAGMACDPTQIGVAVASGGADCGERSACTTPVRTSLACIGIGPADARAKSRGFSGSQAPISQRALPDGVFDQIPVKGFVVWNSHAFNLTQKDTTVEQWINLEFVGPEFRTWRAQGIFDNGSIFQMGPIQPFEKNEICRTFTLDRYSNVIDFSSHVHQRGTLFRIWDPPQPTGCTPKSGCAPDTTKDPFYTSEIYNDPVEIRYEPALVHDSASAEDRTYKFCGVFDNGAEDLANLKLNSQAADSSVCSFSLANCGCEDEELRCANDSTNTVSCMGDDSLCDTSSGAGDGDCDACPLRGGITTDDEMFILLGTFFVKPPAE